MPRHHYRPVPFSAFVVADRARALEWRLDRDGVERGYDHEHHLYCVAPGAFPALKG